MTLILGIIQIILLILLGITIYYEYRQNKKLTNINKWHIIFIISMLIITLIGLLN